MSKTMRDAAEVQGVPDHIYWTAFGSRDAAELGVRNSQTAPVDGAATSSEALAQKRAASRMHACPCGCGPIAQHKPIARDAEGNPLGYSERAS